MGYSLGVDLGTTFVAAAVARATKVEMFTLGDRSMVSPAIVYLREDGTLLTGEAASRRAVSGPDRVGREFKRRLGNPTPVILGGQAHSVTVLLGTLLRDVVQKVNATEGTPPDRVMLTHPANWGPFRRALFEEVPQHAGLANLPVVTEPEAAAAHYTKSRQLADGETVAVYDLGGGTFDATVLRKQPGGIEILGTPEGIERLGGVDFDELILSYVDYTAGGALRELDMRDRQTTVALARLRQDCILAKEALSVDTETILPVLLPGQHFDVHLTRSDFEDMVRAPIESTIGALSRTLQSAQVDPAELSAILLVGGSSRIPLVARMVAAELGRPTVVDTHPKYAVALGAATLASRLSVPHTVPHTNGQVTGPQSAGRQSAGRQTAGRQTDGRPIRGQQLPTAPVAVANVLSAAGSQQREPLIPATDPAGVVPPPPDALATDALGGGATSPIATTGGSPAPQAPPPTVDTRLPTDRPPVPESQRTGPAESGNAPDTAGPPGLPGPPPLGALPDRERRRRALISTGALLALAGMVTLVIFIVFSVLDHIRAASPPAPANEPVPTTARPTAGPEVPIPAFVATIPVGKSPQFIAVTPNGRHVYVANGEAQVVTVLDTAINQVTATIPIAAGPPQFLTFAPDGRKLYVSIFNAQKTIHAVDVIDTTSNTVVATIPQPARPFLPAVTPNGKLLYIPNHDVASVSVVATDTNKVIAQISVPANPHWVAFSRDGSRAYTANHESNVISVIDTGTLKVLTTVPVGKSPHSIAVSPSGSVVANVNYDSNSVTVIDTRTLKVLATIPVGKNPRDIIWAPDGRFTYVVNEDTNNVSVIDAATYKITATIPVGIAPNSIAVLPNGRQAYVSNINSGTLTVLDLTG
ncbi:MAG TPA: Hsp70 family protein [Pseudonocardiaceae bacterium]